MSCLVFTFALYLRVLNEFHNREVVFNKYRISNSNSVNICSKTLLIPLNEARFFLGSEELLKGERKH